MGLEPKATSLHQSRLLGLAALMVHNTAEGRSNSVISRPPPNHLPHPAPEWLSPGGLGPCAEAIVGLDGSQSMGLVWCHREQYCGPGGSLCCPRPHCCGTCAVLQGDGRLG